MRLPTIVVNCKTYPEALGKRGWDLARRLAAVAQETGASVVLAPPASDLAHVAKLVRIPVFAQHVDAVTPGPTTGWLPPESLLEAARPGTLINHSPRKVAWEGMGEAGPRRRGLGLQGITRARDSVHAENLPQPSPRDNP